MKVRNEVMARVLANGGGIKSLAEALGIKPQAVSQWDEVPPLRVIAVEKATGIPRHELRPDLYPLDEACA